jgi:hypothetical protein
MPGLLKLRESLWLVIPGERGSKTRLPLLSILGRAANSLAHIVAAVGLPVGLILAGLDRKNLPHQHWVGYGLSGRRLHQGARQPAILAHL